MYIEEKMNRYTCIW